MITKEDFKAATISCPCLSQNVPEHQRTARGQDACVCTLASKKPIGKDSYQQKMQRDCYTVHMILKSSQLEVDL